MFSLSLGIERLPRDAGLLTMAGVHWLSLARRDDMLLLVRQLIAGVPAEQQTALVTSEALQQEVMNALPEQAGPERISLFELKPGRRGAGLKRLTMELKRAGVRSGLLILIFSEKSVDGLGGKLTCWAESFQQWAEQQGVAVLVLCYGADQVLPAELAGRLGGWLRLERYDGGVRLIVKGWRNRFGWLAGVHYELQHHQYGFAVKPELARQYDHMHEAEGVLVQQAALEQVPPPAEGWRMVEHEETFWQHALTATEGTLVAAVSHNEAVPELARRLHLLRTMRGSGLRMVVRKLRPCLRDAEQELLLHCGANLVIPSGLSHANFLALLRCLHGQRWQRPLVSDVRELLQRFQPPSATGLMSPAMFYRQADAVFRAGSDETSHQLLALPLRAGLSPQLCLSQLNLRRQGDLACFLQGSIYLFLFACPDEARAAALGNICRLPWQELFTECRALAGTDALPRTLFEQNEDAPETEPPIYSGDGSDKEKTHFGCKPFFLKTREG